ncbi:hypothetical protein F5883DRAFT_543622 [Diaporthe sp. PMI_573]|nr:hypothetical protein F5883DRAFT_543622 [Diaporthaceae sp. PMI_573]
MGQQMTDRQRSMLTRTIQNAYPCPKDIDDCLCLLEKERILAMDKAETFWAEFVQVCQQAMDIRPLTPPTRAISPPSPAYPLPGTLHADGALLAAAHSSRHIPTLTVHLYNSGTFYFANVKFTNADFSYILEKRAKKLGLQCSNGIVQIEWKDPNLPHDGDHTARETVFVVVSEEEASRVEMKVDILFGKHCREKRDVQLEAVHASVGIQSTPLPSEVQLDDLCAGSVAEPASPPMQALDSVPLPFNCTAVFIGPDSWLQAVNYVGTLRQQAPRQPGTLGGTRT